MRLSAAQRKLSSADTTTSFKILRLFLAPPLFPSLQFFDPENITSSSKNSSYLYGNIAERQLWLIALKVYESVRSTLLSLVPAGSLLWKRLNSLLRKVLSKRKSFTMSQSDCFRLTARLNRRSSSLVISTFPTDHLVALSAVAGRRLRQPPCFAMYLFQEMSQISFTMWRLRQSYSETPSRSSAEVG